MKFSKEKVFKRMMPKGIRTQKELADHLGLSMNTISLLMNGGAFRSETLELFCLKLECTPNDLLDVPSADPHGHALIGELVAA